MSNFIGAASINSLLDFGDLDLDLVFKVTVRLSFIVCMISHEPVGGFFSNLDIYKTWTY